MFQTTIPKVPQEMRVLSEIIEYILDKNNPPLKVLETLNINHDDKNIIMSLLERRDLYNVKRLFAISNLIFTHPEILMKKDKDGKDVLSYFIEFATYDLIDTFIEMLSTHSSSEEKKSILSSVDNDGKSHLIMMCENKKFETLEGTFKKFIDLIASSCGMDFLYEMLTKPDNNGNNIVMAALKNHNYKVAMRIVELIPKTVLDNEIRIKIEHKLLTQRDSHSKNILILLSELNPDNQLQDEIVRLVKEIPSNWMCLTQNDSEGHNTILLAVMNSNQKMLDDSFSILSAMSEDDKKLVLADLCKKFDSKGNNFISLCLKLSQSEIYLKLVEEMEKTIGEQLIIECFGKTFSIHKDLLHYALLENNMSAILSIIKYLKLVNNISENDKIHIAELITRKDNNNRSLLSYAVQKSNYQVCEMILSSAKQFCDPITIKIMLSSKDQDGNTPYVMVKINCEPKLEELFKKFAEDTGNKELITEQIKSFQQINEIKSSHVKQLVTEVFT